MKPSPAGFWGALAAGAALTLTFSYTSPLRTNNNGLYLSTYLDDNAQQVLSLIHI